MALPGTRGGGCPWGTASAGRTLPRRCRRPGSPHRGREGRGTLLPGKPSRFSITPHVLARGQGRRSSRSLRSAPAQAPVRVLAGAAAAAAARAAGRAQAPVRVPAEAAAPAGVPVAVPTAPATVWAAATAAASGAAGAAAAAVAAVAGGGPAVVRLVRAVPVPAVLAPARRDRRVLRRRALRARGRALLASGDDSPPGAGYPARRRMRRPKRLCPLAPLAVDHATLS